MKQVKLSEKEIIESANHSSKGNQPKWCVDGTWYKVDHMGYEGLAEVVISRLLKKTNVTNFVEYYPCKIEFDYHNRSGCYSHNFLHKGYELIPLERLHRLYTTIGLSQKLKEFDNAMDKIKYTVDFVEDVTKIKDFGKYLTAMLEIDAFFLNEDRHTNNIAIVRNPNINEFSLCPYFDQGLSLLSDLDGFWLDGDTEKHIARVNAKPFATFKKQVEAAQELYGKQLDVRFTVDDVNSILDDLNEYYNPEIINRVKYIIERQINK